MAAVPAWAATRPCCRFAAASLAESVARRGRAAGRSVDSGRRPRAVAGYPAIPDLYPGEGPLGGILTALRHTRADWNLIVACDMPELTPGFLAELLDAADAPMPTPLLPAGPSGRPEPLCAVYHRRCLASPRRGLRARRPQGRGRPGETSPRRAYPVAEVAHFQNVNTPEDWAGYAAE